MTCLLWFQEEALCEKTVWSKVERSFQQSSHEVCELLHNKLQYLHTCRVWAHLDAGYLLHLSCLLCLAASGHNLPFASAIDTWTPLDAPGYLYHLSSSGHRLHFLLSYLRPLHLDTTYLLYRSCVSSPHLYAVYLLHQSCVSSPHWDGWAHHTYCISHMSAQHTRTQTTFCISHKSAYHTWTQHLYQSHFSSLYLDTNYLLYQSHVSSPHMRSSHLLSVSVTCQLTTPGLNLPSVAVTSKLTTPGHNIHSVAATRQLTTPAHNIPSVAVTCWLTIPAHNLPSVAVTCQLATPACNVPSVAVTCQLTIPAHNLPSVAVACRLTTPARNIPSVAVTYQLTAPGTKLPSVEVTPGCYLPSISVMSAYHTWTQSTFCISHVWTQPTSCISHMSAEHTWTQPTFCITHMSSPHLDSIYLLHHSIELTTPGISLPSVSVTWARYTYTQPTFCIAHHTWNQPTFCVSHMSSPHLESTYLLYQSHELTTPGLNLPSVSVTWAHHTWTRPTFCISRMSSHTWINLPSVSITWAYHTWNQPTFCISHMSSPHLESTYLLDHSHVSSTYHLYQSCLLTTPLTCKNSFFLSAAEQNTHLLWTPVNSLPVGVNICTSFLTAHLHVCWLQDERRTWVRENHARPLWPDLSYSHFACPLHLSSQTLRTVWKSYPTEQSSLPDTCEYNLINLFITAHAPAGRADCVDIIWPLSATCT